jgi:AcrR family transcriptional regulator
MAATSARTAARIGRPPKVDEFGTPTRERLLNAAVEACVEHGYDGVTLSDIARRSDVSTPAIYSHFNGKAELLVAASRRELERIQDRNASATGDVRSAVRRWADPDNQNMRTLVVELHQASMRYPDVAELLGEWHRENAELLADRTGMSTAQIKLFYLVLMGLSHQEHIQLDIDQSELIAELDALVDGWLGG